MNWSTSFLGATIAEKMQERSATPILRIGNDTFRRADFARLECYNFMAVINLSNHLAKSDIQVKNTRELYDKISPRDLALPGVGAFSLAVLGAAFQAKGIGGARPLDSWDKKHHPNGEGGVTWHTYKARAAHEDATERKQLAKRKHSRKNQAQEIRVERFTTRKSVATAADTGEATSPR